jgi:anti-sigma B factor antagonist
LASIVGMSTREGWPLSAADAISTSVDRRDGITVLLVDGVVDLATSPPLEELLAELIEEEPKALVVDLTDVSFLASVGLRILAETHERVGGTGKFAVVATGPVTARPIQLTKLDEFLALYPTLDDALTALRA